VISGQGAPPFVEREGEEEQADSTRDRSRAILLRQCLLRQPHGVEGFALGMGGFDTPASKEARMNNVVRFYI
jgi:hypothetical protein